MSPTAGVGTLSKDLGASVKNPKLSQTNLERRIRPAISYSPSRCAQPPPLLVERWAVEPPLPLVLKKGLYVIPKNMGGDSAFKHEMRRGNALSCLALHKLGHSVRPGGCVLNEVCFSLAGCPEEHRSCSPGTFREAHRSWKLKALFTFSV